MKLVVVGTSATAVSFLRRTPSTSSSHDLIRVSPHQSLQHSIAATRPHGSNAASRDWSVGPHEPYWRTNTSYSPPPSRWDFRFQSEGLSYGLHDGIQLYGSSTSSNGKDSRGWVSGNHLYDLHYSASDGTGAFLSSPSDLSQGPQWTPPAIQEISINDYETPTRRGPSLTQISFTRNKEGTSEDPDSVGSTSTQSESSESETTTKSRLLQRNFSKHCSFISKPIYPFLFPDISPAREALDPAVASSSEYDASNPLRDVQRWSSASSTLDLSEVSELFQSETCGRPHIPSDGSRCSLCERLLSHRSPWSTRRIVRSGDMPTTGVLPCCHVFHAECLEQATPKTQKSDPPCPLCARLPGNGFPRLRPFGEDGPSRPWGCAQGVNSVEGLGHAPPRNTMFLLNRNLSKKNLSLKGNLAK
ncbi:hypothetical protein PIB30_008780 [Stylosanthes scabra]|uniref:RING-type domain-containing protein n=1 Tax=Stylosanthes scabra TaxID=79078 RepID=A0ABU6W4J4_9FABA|nr:hypothetical protein [Stylosanthes scabra]